jgi:hypothetical protein
MRWQETAHAIARNKVRFLFIGIPISALDRTARENPRPVSFDAEGYFWRWSNVMQPSVAVQFSDWIADLRPTSG